MSCKPMILINDKNNMCKTAVSYKQRRNATKQLELNFNASRASHNIYLSKLGKLSKRLHKSNLFKQPVRTVRFNKLGCTDILSIQIDKIKSFYKDTSGTYIEVAGILNPIALRESLSEINHILNRS